MSQKAAGGGIEESRKKRHAITRGIERGTGENGEYIPEIVEQAISCKWAKGASGPAGDEHHNLIAYAPKIAPTMGASGAPYERTGNARIEADALVVSRRMWVRRLTPMECERLMGFPDGYTAIEYRGKIASDSARYRALGNSMAVPVMHWLGKRIAEYAIKSTCIL